MCSVNGARARCLNGDFIGAIREVGPILEADYRTLQAWLIAASALSGLGDKEAAVTQLNRLVHVSTLTGRLLVAIQVVKTLAQLGESTSASLDLLAQTFAVESNAIADSRRVPPPLPVTPSGGRWKEADDLEAVTRVKTCMEAAWQRWQETPAFVQGQAFVPILSNLGPADFVLFVNTLEQMELPPGAWVVRQGEVGDAFFIIVEGQVAVIHRDDSGEETVLKTLGPGAFFGEMALVSRAQRAADVLTEEHTVLFRAGREQVDALFNRAPKIGEVLISFCHDRMLENLIRISPVLAPVPPSERPALISAFDTDYKNAGEPIITEGEKGNGLYLIVSGEVEATKMTPTGERRIATLGPGDILGEISLLMRRPATATLRARENTALLFLSTEAFMAVTGQYPEFLKGAFDIALSRDTENNSILAIDKRAVDEWCLL